MWKPVLIGLLAAGAVSASAAAQSCGQEIGLLAQQYGLSSERAQPPEAPAGTPQPPATSESRGIPPSDTPSGSAEPGRSPSPGATITAALSPAKRTKMQALLDAAREAQAQGNEAECLEKIGEARAVPEPG